MSPLIRMDPLRRRRSLARGLQRALRLGRARGRLRTRPAPRRRPCFRSAQRAGWEGAQSAGHSDSRYGWRMKVTRAGENVFALTLTGQELSALVAGARMALDIMERDPHAPREAVELLRGVVGDYDDALARLKAPDGRPGRPSG